jgi:4-hydroxybenzoate polyprenyltransferase
VEAWRRLIENDKPVFTVVFGGAGVLASALGEIAKHFYLDGAQ